jgi:hypothetical protein
MIFNEGTAILSDNPSFETVLDRTCKRLLGKKIQYSLRRIQELERDLCSMEQELEEYLHHRPDHR